MDLAERIVAGDVRAAARVMRWLDDGDPQAVPVLARLHPHTGQARILGITGSPGTGKSTLIDGLVRRLRQAGRRVGVVAVDPTSPFTGGAILGDRVRMARHAADPGVFIRSLATRGRMGGLSASAVLVSQVLDAMGFDRILLETVGVGQDEVDVVRHADVTVVVVAPGQGDEVQAQKAGVLEIADILVVNKGDLDGADRTVLDLQQALDLGPPGERRPRVMRCASRFETGLDDLVAEIEARLSEREGPGRHEALSHARTAALVADLVLEGVAARLESLMASDGEVRVLLEAVDRRQVDPFQAAAALLDRIQQAPPDRP